MRTISIEIGKISLRIELDDSPTALAVASALPIESLANRWGDEIYFETPVRLPKAKEAREQVQIGEVGYWPPGHAFCIFFGPTPASQDERPRAASPVNVFGKVLEDPSILRRVKDGAKVLLRSIPS